MVWWIHAIHVLAATVIVGGSTAHALGQAIDPRQYERWFWGAIGLSVATGVGNIATRAPLPPMDTLWGVAFAIKLVLVIALLALSVRRSILAWNDAVERPLYVATASISGVLLVMGVGLAHGAF